MLRFIRRLLHFPGRALLAALVITGTLLASPVSAGLRRDAPHSEDAIEAHHIRLSANGCHVVLQPLDHGRFLSGLGLYALGQ